MSASTASANSTERCSFARSASKTDADIIRAFYKLSTISLKNNKLFWSVNDSLIGMKLSHAISSKAASK